jgi:hypothetical protein
VLDELAVLAAARLPTFQGRHLGLCLSYLGKLQYAPSNGLVGLMQREIKRDKERIWDAQAVANTLHGLAKVGCYDKEVFKKLLSIALPILTSFTPQGLSISLWAMGKVNHYDARALEAFSSAAVAGVHLFQPQNLSNTSMLRIFPIPCGR